MWALIVLNGPRPAECAQSPGLRYSSGATLFSSAAESRLPGSHANFLRASNVTTASVTKVMGTLTTCTKLVPLRSATEAKNATRQPISTVHTTWASSVDKPIRRATLMPAVRSWTMMMGIVTTSVTTAAAMRGPGPDARKEKRPPRV